MVALPNLVISWKSCSKFSFVTLSRLGTRHWQKPINIDKNVKWLMPTSRLKFPQTPRIICWVLLHFRVHSIYILHTIISRCSANVLEPSRVISTFTENLPGGPNHEDVMAQTGIASAHVTRAGWGERVPPQVVDHVISRASPFKWLLERWREVWEWFSNRRISTYCWGSIPDLNSHLQEFEALIYINFHFAFLCWGLLTF